MQEENETGLVVYPQTKWNSPGISVKTDYIRNSEN